MKKIFTVCLIFSALACFAHSGSAPAMSSRPTRDITYPVRVAVAIDSPEVKLKIKGNYAIYALPLVEKLKEGLNLEQTSEEER